MGIVICICALMVYYATASLLPRTLLTATHIGDANHWTKREGVLGVFLVLATCLSNGFAEELVMSRLPADEAGISAPLHGVGDSRHHGPLRELSRLPGRDWRGGPAAMGLVCAIAFCLQPPLAGLHRPCPLELHRDDAGVSRCWPLPGNIVSDNPPVQG